VADREQTKVQILGCGSDLFGKFERVGDGGGRRRGLREAE
jgi:hypothetical protein